MASQPAVRQSPFAGSSSLAVSRRSPMEEAEEPRPQSQRRGTLDVPWRTDVEATNPQAADAEAADAGAADAEATKAEATDTEATDTEATDSKTTKAGATDAETTDAKATEAEAAEAEATDPKATEATDCSSPGCCCPSNLCRHPGCLRSPGPLSPCSHSPASRSPCSRPSGFQPPRPGPFKQPQVTEAHRQPAARPKRQTFPRDEGGRAVGHRAAAGVCDGEIPSLRRGQIRTDGRASHPERHSPPGRPPSTLDPVPPWRVQPSPPQPPAVHDQQPPPPPPPPPQVLPPPPPPPAATNESSSAEQGPKEKQQPPSLADETQEKVYARFFEMAGNLSATFEKQHKDLGDKLERHQKMVSSDGPWAANTSIQTMVLTQRPARGTTCLDANAVVCAGEH
jgi:hypothetical protein